MSGRLLTAQNEVRCDSRPCTNQTPGHDRSELARGIIDADRAVQILRGTNQGQPPVNFYFDNSGLLVRMMLWADTLVGPVATQYDYSEYREVGGVRRPHRIVKTSTINQVTLVLKQMQPNAAIDDARFAKPTTTRLIK